MKSEEAIKQFQRMKKVLPIPNLDVKIRIEAIDMAIEALKAEPTHGRLIDADALMDYCSNQKTKTISNNDIARFPTAQVEVAQGEWIYKGDYAICSKCGGSSGTQYDGVERIPRITAFCPHCGRRMKGAEHEID